MEQGTYLGGKDVGERQSELPRMGLQKKGCV